MKTWPVNTRLVSHLAPCTDTLETSLFLHQEAWKQGSPHTVPLKSVISADGLDQKADFQEKSSHAPRSMLKSDAELRDRPAVGCAPASPEGGAGSLRTETPLRSVSAGAVCSAPRRLNAEGPNLGHVPASPGPAVRAQRPVCAGSVGGCVGVRQPRGHALCHVRPPPHSGGCFQLGVQVQTQVTGRPGKAQRAAPPLGATTLHARPPSCRSSCCAQ